MGQILRIIKIVPSKRFGGSWTADEGDGVAPAYKDKQRAIDYAKTRFSGFQEGEIHVYGAAAVEVIKVMGSRYGQPRWEGEETEKEQKPAS